MTNNRKSSIPKHVGIILDGNRRWALEHDLPKFEGHKAGYENLKVIAEHATNLGVKYISAYIFSTENWNRSKDEVKYLLDLALWVATREVNKVHKQGIRIRFLGSKEGLSDKLVVAIGKAEKLTSKNDRGTLALCFNYGGQQEILDAVNKLLQGKSKKVTKKKFEDELYAPDIPPIDLIIRTSGEQRLSNYMLWRAVYAELYFVNQHWPAFTTRDFDLALEEYANRQRRFGT